MHTFTVACDPPTQLLHRPVVVVMGPDNPLIKGQFITYTCPPRFVLTGPNASVCMIHEEQIMGNQTLKKWTA